MMAVERREEQATEKSRVLFLCTHNSARSQMAEGLLRDLAGERFEVFSAGTEVTHVRPQAIKVMKELGIDISRQESKTLERYLGEPFDYVITVCDDANEACPMKLYVKRKHATSTYRSLTWPLPGLYRMLENFVCYLARQGSSV